MTFTKPSLQSQQQRLLESLEMKWPNKANLPTMYDLPSEDPEEPGLPDEFHDYQPALLSETFTLQGYTRENTFSAADLNLYYDPQHNWYKRPDWFGVIGKPAGASSDELRMSYVVWQEARRPFVVVELISPGTENEDFGRTVSQPGEPPTKWTVYEEILKIPYYVIYDRYKGKLNGFRLIDGLYQPIEIGTDAKIWIPEIKAGLGLWHGKYKWLKQRSWLRWYNEGGWIPTPTEQAQQEAKLAQQKARLAQRDAEQALLSANKTQQENELLKAKLKALGVEIGDLTQENG